MPRLPDLNDLGARPVPQSRRSIVGGVQSDAVARAQSNIGDSVARLGQQISGIGQQMLEKQDKFEFAAAKTELLKADISARQELESDPDHTKYESRYADLMTKAREKASGMIASRSVRAAFDQDATLDYERGRSDVLGIVKKKQTALDTATFITSLDGLQDVARKAPDDATRENAIKTAGDMFDGAVAKGLISPDDAVVKRQAWVSNYLTEQIDTAITAENTSEASRLLERYGDKLDMNDRMSFASKIKGSLDREQAYNDALDTAPGISAEPSGARGGVSSFINKTRMAESGGNDAARNPNSSAEGRYQFTNKTWIATYKAEFGKTGETDSQILAKKRDGATQDRLMNRLTQANAAALRGAGLSTTDGNLYLAHFAGAGGAVDILRANPSTPIEKIIGQDAVRANPFLKGKTTGQVAEWAAKKMGGVQQGPRRWDVNAWLGNIDKRADAEGWSFDRRERAKDAARRQVSTDETILARQEQEADRQAGEWMLSQRDKFIDPTQIPRTIWNNMSTSARAQATNTAASNAKGREPEANSPYQWQLTALRFSDPQKFAAMNLSEYMGKITRAEMDSALEDQAKLRAGGGSVNIRSNISGAISFHSSLDKSLSTSLDVKKNPEAYSRVFQDMEGYIKAVTKGQREPTDDELKTAFGRATMKVMVPGRIFGSNEVSRFDLEPGQKYQVAVPVAIRQRIIDSYKRHNRGALPPDGLIGSIYVQNKGKPGFWN